MQTTPGKSLTTSLMRKRRAFNDMYFQTYNKPEAQAKGIE
jgi:hypothetical protein